MPSLLATWRESGGERVVRARNGGSLALLHTLSAVCVARDCGQDIFTLVQCIASAGCNCNGVWTDILTVTNVCELAMVGDDVWGKRTWSVEQGVDCVQMTGWVMSDYGNKLFSRTSDQSHEHTYFVWNLQFDKGSLYMDDCTSLIERLSWWSTALCLWQISMARHGTALSNFTQSAADCGASALDYKVHKFHIM